MNQAEDGVYGDSAVVDKEAINLDSIDVSNAGERVVAGDSSWCYIAHLSLYELAAPLVKGKRVLDAGCGTGYGSVHLLDYDPISVVACDGSAVAIAFCQRQYEGTQVTFETVDLGKPLPYPNAFFDMIYSSNVMEHIGPIDVFLAECRRILAPSGKFFIAVPPNATPELLEENIRNIHHITNLTPLGWHTKIARYFGAIQSFRHWGRGKFSNELTLFADASSTAGQSKMSKDDFVLEEMGILDLNTCTQNITAVFIASEPRTNILEENIMEFVPQNWCMGAITAKIIKSERDIAAAAQAEIAALKSQLAMRPEPGGEFAVVLQQLTEIKIRQETTHRLLKSASIRTHASKLSKKSRKLLHKSGNSIYRILERIWLRVKRLISV